MWERRYGFPRPERASGGSRLYTAEDVEVLRLIQGALEQGYRPGEVVGKSRAELRRLLHVASASPLGAAQGAQGLATILAAVTRDDVAVLRGELRQAAVLLGPKRFVVEVAHPLSVRVGELWADGKLEVRHEHLLTDCLSSQLRVLLAAYEDRPGMPRVLLATLPGERHGLGLAMTAVYLGANQVTPISLGVETPAPEVVKAARSHEVDAVGLLVTAASDLEATQRDVWSLRGELPRRTGIWLGGAAASLLPIADESVRIVGSFSALDDAVASLRDTLTP